MAVFPNVEPARNAIEKLMVDTCLITRDPPGVRDDTWDPVTGTYAPPAGDESIVYGPDTLGDDGRVLAGKCVFGPVQNRADLPRVEGGATTITRLYSALLPWDAPEVRPGDLFTVVTSARDPRAPGRTLVILTEVIQTILIARRITMEEVADAFSGIRGA